MGIFCFAYCGERMTGRSEELHVIPVPFAGEVQPGDSLLEKLLQAMRHHRVQFKAGDVLVVKHKIVSKAEGRIVDLKSVKPSADSRIWARRYKLDARVVELALSESKRIVRRKRGVLITETDHGFVCANSGIDVSNVDGGQRAVLLPENSDRSALRLHQGLKKRTGVAIPVIVTDSFGRPWREGLTEVAIGVAGMKPLLDYRGRRDSHGYQLCGSVEAVADELAGAAGLVCGKLARTPACVIRGFGYEQGRGSGKDLLRPARNDLFR
jgi:coenzyme F420-0:L-glutamate ligase / coenzyme F420-1:gamma-L-glutamate ligase